MALRDSFWGYCCGRENSLSPAAKLGEFCVKLSEFGLAHNLAHQNRTTRKSLTISALTEPNRQKFHRKKGFWAQKSQPEIANGQRLSISIAPLNRNAALLSLVAEIAAISGVRDGHRNGKSQKSLRFRCAKAKKLTELGVWNHALRDRIRPVSFFCFFLLRFSLSFCAFLFSFPGFFEGSAERAILLFFVSKERKNAIPQNQRAENGALDPWSLDLRLGRPRFLPQIAPKPFKIRGFGASGLKIGAPQKRRLNDHGSNAPFSALWQKARIGGSGQESQEIPFSLSKNALLDPPLRSNWALVT